MGDTEEPGRHKYPRGGYTSGMFSGVSSPDDFADVLGVPKKAIGCIRPQNTNCKTKNCPFNAIRNNGGHCPAHSGVGIRCRTNVAGIFMGLTFLGLRRMATEPVIVIKRHVFPLATFHRRRVQYTSLRRGLKQSAIHPISYPVRKNKNVNYAFLLGTSSKSIACFRMANGNCALRKVKNIMTWKGIHNTTFLHPETHHGRISTRSTTCTSNHRINGHMTIQMSACPNG